MATNQKIIVENPDKERIYHCWHYCQKCKKAFRHSQSEMDRHKNHDCLTFPKEQNWEEVEVD